MNRSKIADDLSAMIQIKTVSYDNPARMDAAEFERFRGLLAERFPVLAERCLCGKIGSTGILYKISGRSDAKPSVLMAHYDVVPADASAWKHDPFSGEILDGRIIGRGALDTKSTLCAILEAAEDFLKAGETPENDIYLSFGGEEETCGETCAFIVEEFKKRKIHPAFVLDEGGAVIPEGLPGMKRMAAMVGIAEKGTANYMLTVEDKGGHTSTPPRHTALGRLARAAVRIENHPFPARLSNPVRLMFRELSAEVPPYEKFAFGHPELLEPAIKTAASALGGTFNAMVRSTAAIVIMEGRSAFNVLPDKAAMGVNVRLLEGDTVESAAEYLKKIVADPSVQVDIIAGTDPSPVSDISCGEWELLKSVIHAVWPQAVAAPYQLNGGTDARHYAEISEHVYRFSPMIMTKEERGSVHGSEESIAVRNLLRMCVFYSKLLRKL